MVYRQQDFKICVQLWHVLYNQYDREPVSTQSKWILLKKIGLTNETFAHSIYIGKLHVLKIIIFQFVWY